jgi:triose/dihydroxyacetone kinase / FAD-AMP lyase (cyclizing)
MAEPKITAFDTTMGDGDCGTTLVAGALSITCELHQIDTASLTHATLSISELISKGMGGTSGAMYAIFFTSFAAAAQSLSATKMPMLQLVASMANTALATLREYTAAAIGDRTMMDALIPFISALSEGAEDGLPAVQALENALEMAKRGCDSTRNMTSVFGRSTYVGAGDNDIDPTKGIPDPGACGIVAIAEGILQGFKESVAAV